MQRFAAYALLRVVYSSRKNSNKILCINRDNDFLAPLKQPDRSDLLDEQRFLGLYFFKFPRKLKWMKKIQQGILDFRRFKMKA